MLQVSYERFSSIAEFLLNTARVVHVMTLVFNIVIF